MAYRVISADCHMDLPWLPADLFVSNAPQHLKEKMPRVEETPQGGQWMVEGRSLGFVGGGSMTGVFDLYVPGHSKRLDRMEDVGFFSDAAQGRLRPSSPELRVRDQKLDGIDAEVIYGVLGLAGTTGLGIGEAEESYGIHDREVLVAVYDIYNEWAADFAKSDRTRLAALGTLCNHDPALAAKQLRRAAELGLRGAEMNAATAVVPIYFKDWDVLWGTAAECHMPISFHTVGIPTRDPGESRLEEYRWTYTGMVATVFQLAGAEFLSSILFSGACERHPDFKFVLGECGVGWIPYVLGRMDDQFDRMQELKLELKPSEYWRRQGHSTFQVEPLTREIVSAVGEDNIMWGSDYPHPDCVFPDSQQTIEDNLGALRPEQRYKVICGNAARLYGFE